MILNALFFAVVICFVIPPVLALIFVKLYTKTKPEMPWGKFVLVFLLGSFSYLIAEHLIKNMLLIKSILPLFEDTDWYYNIFIENGKNSVKYYSLLMGCTSAILQETFRFFLFFAATATILKKINKTSFSVRTPVVYGLGSGFADAIICLGIMAFSYLAKAPDEAGTLNEAFAFRVMLAGIERFIQLFYQVGYTMYIIYGIKYKKKIVMTLITILLHAVLLMADIYLGKIGLEYATLNYINAAAAALLCISAYILFKNAGKSEEKSL